MKLRLSIFSIIITTSMAISADNGLKVGDEAPSFYLTTLTGQNFFLSDELKKGKPVLLNFFATWCGPCKKELPDIYALSQTYKKVSFYIIDVSNLEQNGKKLVETPEEVRSLLEKMEIKLPVLMDKYGLIAGKYKAVPLPKTVIISPDGKLIFEQTGMIAKDDPKLIKALQSS